MKKVKLIDRNFVGAASACLYLPADTGWICDDTNHDIRVYTDNFCFSSELDNSKINCAWLVEPPIINGGIYQNILEHYKNFKYVFSFLRSLETKINNFVYIPFGTSHIRQEDINIFDKTKLISMIFSSKRWNPFHNLRHEIYEKFKNNNISFFGCGTGERLPLKVTGLKDYMFSIIVENSAESDYFTEKLLDCFLTGTVPIYLGCPSIGKYFNSKGILTFNTLDELSSVLNSASAEFYNSLKSTIIENFETAKKYIHPEHLIQEHLSIL